VSDQAYAVHQNYAGTDLWRGKQPLLPHLDLELTERCNNACLHCYINLPEADAQAQARELTTCEWKDVISQAAGLGALSLRFTGGEPLLREDFAELYEHARRSGLRVTIFTNGRRITPELAELFARMPPLEKIQVTVYGLHPGSYTAVACDPDGYTEFKRGIDLLLEKQVPFIVKGAWLPPTLDETDQFKAWAASLPWAEPSPSYAMAIELRGRRDSPARNRLIQSLRLDPEQVAALGQDNAGYRKEMREFCQRFMGPKGMRLFGCGAGRGGAVDAYGRMQPCMLLRDPRLSYDLRHASGIRPDGLREALQDFFPALRQMEAANPQYLQRCARCFLGGLCEQCPARSWSEHGTLDTPVEYHCQVAHAKARRLGLLQPGEQAWEVQDWKSRLQNLESEVEESW
jgi:radical SAM protein with 4Fe4S-binding SPASM domain